jgi:hypothetical protein
MSISLAAKAAGLPSILITNFTFDSVYSYLSTPLIDKPTVPSTDGHLAPTSAQQSNFSELIPDIPVPLEELQPLVEQIVAGYRCANILFLLPGNIPIPSFSRYPSLPAQDWICEKYNRPHPEVAQFLANSPQSYTLIPGPSSTGLTQIPRAVISAPLLVRSPDPSIYTTEGRSRFLSSIGIPLHLYDAEKTKILIVSFGGQVFRAPSRASSRNHSRSNSPHPSPTRPDLNGTSNNYTPGPLPTTAPAKHLSGIDLGPVIQKPLVTPSHIWIPGAPPAHKSSSSQSSIQVPNLFTIPPTPPVNTDTSTLDFAISDEEDEGSEAALLPDSSWIAIVCGVSKEQWATQSEGLPDGFFVAPKDIYMPDLTAVADVLLGKLVCSLTVFTLQF